MRPNVTITDLVKLPNFGANIIIKRALENLVASVFISYSLLRDEKLLRMVTHCPSPLNEETFVRKYVDVKYDANDELVVALFDGIKQGKFIDEGEVLNDKLKEAVIPVREAQLNKDIGYGTNPTLTKVVRGGGTRAILYFTTNKDNKVKHHQASWSVTDISTDFTKQVSIPKPLFSTYREFLAILAEVLEVEASRFLLKKDPTEVVENEVEVFINPSDLTYKGSIKVSLPDTGDVARVIDKFTVTTTEGEETDPEGGEVIDPPKPVVGVMYLTTDPSAEVNAENITTGTQGYIRIAATNAVSEIDVNVQAIKDLEDAVIELSATTGSVPVGGYLTIPFKVVSASAEFLLEVTANNTNGFQAREVIEVKLT